MALSLGWFRSWFRREAFFPQMQVVMYSRKECPLCETAWAQLEEMQRQYLFQLETVDIDTDSELQKLHGEHVPVIAVDGKIRFRGAINPILFQRLLDREMERNQETGQGFPEP